MTSLSSVVLLLSGVVFLGIVTQESEAAGGYTITVPGNFQLKQLPERKCLALTWRGVCANNTCISKIKRTLSRKSGQLLASDSTETQLFHPFQIPNTTFFRYQAVCYYDQSSENSSCCDKIISGLKATAQPVGYSDYDWIKFKISRYHVNDTSGSLVFTETKPFVLPWQDSCVSYKPCGDEGTCDNEMKPRHFNCSCISGWKGDNCTIPKGLVYAANKCLQDVKAEKELVDQTVKQCVTECKAMGTSKCKSFEFLTSTGRKGKCSLKNTNTKTNKLVDCLSDYYGIDVTPPSHSTSITAVFATFYVLLACLSRFFMME